ncbi:15702_t:CDS:2 [Gigaspora rosea]|nr:15702_t:CDS:2 [Gigaspora rosea]
MAYLEFDSQKNDKTILKEQRIGKKEFQAHTMKATKIHNSLKSTNRILRMVTKLQAPLPYKRINEKIIYELEKIKEDAELEIEEFDQCSWYTENYKQEGEQKWVYMEYDKWGKIVESKSNEVLVAHWKREGDKLRISFGSHNRQKEENSRRNLRIAWPPNTKRKEYENN